MPKRKKARRKAEKGLDRTARKKLSLRRDTARHGQPVKPLSSRSTRTNRQKPPKASPSVLDERQNPERSKGGRRTIADNFLLGGRNAWLSFFEQCWHEVGWSLLEIRKHRTSTIEEIQKVLEPVRGKPNCYLADCFLRGSPQAVEAKELRTNRIKNSHLHDEIREMRSERREMEFSCAHAENALKEAGEQDKETIEVEAKKRKGCLLELDENLLRAENESNDLDEKVQNQETYRYCLQLLDFLCKGKYAVKPFPLANALAGSPQMGWRQSLARCSKMPKSSFVQYPYGVFEAISRIWESKSQDSQLTATEFFRAELLKLHKKSGDAYIYLCDGWRDLRWAIEEECSKAEHRGDFMPYAITRAFVKNRSRAKTPADLILDEHEKIST
jgi:hypothetical protein